MRQRYPSHKSVLIKSLLLVAAGVSWLCVTHSPSAQESPKKQPVVLPAAAAGKMDFERDIWPILEAKCVSCHNQDKARSGLRLDDKAAAMKGGNSGPVVKPGNAAHSKLLLVVAGLEEDVKMPPSGRDPLSAAEIGRIRAWIEQGAKWPATLKTVSKKNTKTSHWAFQPIERPALPHVKHQDWVRSPIDAFVLAKLEKEGILPSPEASRNTLIRRVYFDLIGLPPSPDAVNVFVNDKSPDAYARMIDRVLASPHYGERWGRHWLDMARYADSDGYEQDRPRPFAWHYRDWVINALNENMPFDQFTIEQLAGDLLPNAGIEQKTATGFHRNTLTNNEGGTDKEQFRVEACVDRVNTTAQVWLGLTLGCAQCHDHKYDPFSQREYYQFFAFFNSDVEKNLVLSGTAKKTKDQVMTLALGKPRKTHVHVRGDFLRPGVEVQADVPSILPALPEKKEPTRLDLANWLVSGDNPLTSRVIVNWIWRHHFGRGIVATPEDFGIRGEKPSHPELLDWLASEFVRQKWNIKEMHKLILTSATYRQVSHVRPELLERDPYNTLLARQKRFRHEAEVIRDNALAVSGLLAPAVGGPSVKPPQPKGVSEITYAGRAKWAEAKGANRFRRGMYTWFQRTSPYPMLLTFDAPESTVTCVRREKSDTPLQALTLLNDTVFVECAQALGRRILTDLPRADTKARIQYAFQLCLARHPDAGELSIVSNLYDKLRQAADADPKAAAKLAGMALVPGAEISEAAAWVAVGRTIMNLDEFVMRE